MTSLTLEKHITSGKLIEKLRLNKKRYFNISEAKNLVAIYEQHIFVWHELGSCILTSDISFPQLKKDNCKCLMLTNPPVFDVESMQFNQTGSLLAITGRNGVMVFEVPWRYGRFSRTSNNDATILGRSWNIAEHFFVCSSRVCVIQTTWHPGSTSNTHLTVLSTDNYIRTYDVTDPQTPQQVISLGPNAKSLYLSSESKMSFSTCLGENAVSFDFGPKETVKFQQILNRGRLSICEEYTIWPIFLLHGNGDVYIIKAPMIKERLRNLCKIEGPLVMYPQAEDNYGFDACSILCLHSSPLFLAIGTATGMLYHCLLLENMNYSNDQEQRAWGNELTGNDCNVALYVFESIELPLTLNEGTDDIYCHPIRLYKDITSHTKYHCTHLSGIHTLCVTLLQTIEEFVEKGQINLISQQQKQSCIIEHVLCTKPFVSMDAVPIVGFDFMVCDPEVMMICLLSTWEVICRPLLCSYHTTAPQLLSESLTRDDANTSGTTDNFQHHIEDILRRSTCSPLLKTFPTTNDTGKPSQLWLDLICSVSQRLREDYIQRLSTAYTLLRSRREVLKQQKDYQLNEIVKCQQEKLNLENGAKNLEKKYEDARARQQLLVHRISTVLHQVQQQLPHLSTSEINMKQKLLSIQEKLKFYEHFLPQMQKKLKHHQEKMKELDASTDSISILTEKVNTMNLSETQLKHVKEILSQEGNSISELIKNVSSLRKQVESNAL